MGEENNVLLLKSIPVIVPLIMALLLLLIGDRKITVSPTLKSFTFPTICIEPEYFESVSYTHLTLPTTPYV